MQPPTPDQFFAEIRASTAAMAGLVRTCDPGLPVPSCPGWTLSDLAAHLGGVHRWAAQTVETRATQRLPREPVACPEDPAGQAAWLTAGAERVIEAVARAGSAPVWAFGAVRPATFWARRQSHETMIHRADAELAAGRAVVLDAGLAADGIDEWLGQLTTVGFRQPGDGSAALRPGAVLSVRATDVGAGWLVGSTGGGLTLARPAAEAGAGDAALTGPAAALLLVLVRRLPVTTPGVAVTGDAGLVRAWLAATPF